MDPRELEQHIDRQLARFASPRAPETLLPRVMAAVRAREAAQTIRDWRSWPLAVQVGLLAAGVLLIAGVTRAWPLLLVALEGSAPAFVQDAIGRIREMALEFDAVFTTATAVWRTWLQPLAILLLVIVAPMFAAFAIFGSALQRIALGGASR